MQSRQDPARNTGRTLRLTFLGAALFGGLGVLATVAPAQSNRSRAAVGLQAARDFCSRCHVVAPGEGRGWTDAPSFEAVANDPATSARSLRDFLRRPHMHMLAYPQARANADDLAAYIMSLRRR